MCAGSMPGDQGGSHEHRQIVVRCRHGITVSRGGGEAADRQPEEEEEREQKGCGGGGGGGGGEGGVEWRSGTCT